MRVSELSLFERFLHLFTTVRPGEGRSALLMLLQGFLLLLAYYLIRPVREALILVEGTPEVRAYAVGAVALTLIFLIPLYKLLFDHLDRKRDKSAILRWVMSFFIANLLAFAAFGALGIPIGVAFFVWVGVFSVMLLAQFWAFSADLFNLKTGQRLFAVLAIGCALGAWIGSQLSAHLFALVGPYRLMLLAAALLACVVWISTLAERSVPAGSRAVPGRVGRAPASLDVLGGFNVVLRSRYLVLIAAFVVLVNWVNATGGYILASFIDQQASSVAAGDALGKRDLIGRIYGDYFAWVTLVQLLLQMFVVSRLIRHFGVRGALLVLPAVMVANYALIATVPVFALVRITMIAENSCSYSIHTTACHSLFLPVTRQEKYVGMTTIDTFFYRFGDLLQALMIFAVTHWLPLDLKGIMLANLVLALAAFGVAVAIGRHHRAEVRDHLINLPPAAGAPLGDIYVPAGQTRVFPVPEDAFLDPDPGDTLRYLARAADGGPLPDWVQFDRDTQTFLLCPPHGSMGCVAVELVATDFEGLQVTSQFRVLHGAGPQPSGVSGQARAAPAPVPPAPGSAAGAGTAPGAPGSRA